MITKYLNLKGKSKIEKEKLYLIIWLLLLFKRDQQDCTPFVEVDNFSKGF